eukprot:347014-Ditylum_brightwellii.AAC.1
MTTLHEELPWHYTRIHLAFGVWASTEPVEFYYWQQRLIKQTQHFLEKGMLLHKMLCCVFVLYSLSYLNCAMMAITVTKYVATTSGNSSKNADPANM